MTRQNAGVEPAASRRQGASDPLGSNSEIGRKLKQYYDELLSDDVPERFSQLLSQLEQAEPLQKKKG
jgi:Anti-sigma factor NepR